MHHRNCLKPEQEGPAGLLWSSIWHKSSLTKNDLMSNDEFLSLTAEVRQRPTGSEEGDNTEGSENNPAKRRRGGVPVPCMGAERMHPWTRSTPYQSGVAGLHEELEDFYKFMRPLTEEKELRQNLVSRINFQICRQWPLAKVEVFGSFRTGLFLPTSDIDMVVFGGWDQLPLHTLGDILVEAKISRREDIKIIDSARVPLVKLVDIDTGIKVDISFNLRTGVASAQMTKSFIERYPVMPKLVLVLKQFLIERNLNEVFTGGIGSYSLILLVVNFLQNHSREDVDSPEANLAVLLIEFFELYGRQFNYDTTAIRITDGGSYFNKSTLTGDHPLSNPSFLTIEDPLDASNDISRGSWGAKIVKNAFEYGYSTLTGAVFNPTDNAGSSVLGRIVKVKEDVIEFRRRALRQWKASGLSSGTESSRDPFPPIASSCRSASRGPRGHVRRHSSPLHTTSEGLVTGSQLTYAAAAGAGRGESAGGRSTRSNSCSSGGNVANVDDGMHVTSPSGSSSSISSSGSGSMGGQRRTGSIRRKSGRSRSRASSQGTDDSSEANRPGRMTSRRLHSYQDNSMGSIANSHSAE